MCIRLLFVLGVSLFGVLNSSLGVIRDSTLNERMEAVSGNLSLSCNLMKVFDFSDVRGDDPLWGIIPAWHQRPTFCYEHKTSKCTHDCLRIIGVTDENMDLVKVVIDNTEIASLKPYWDLSFVGNEISKPHQAAFLEKVVVPLLKKGIFHRLFLDTLGLTDESIRQLCGMFQECPMKLPSLLFLNSNQLTLQSVEMLKGFFDQKPTNPAFMLFLRNNPCAPMDKEEKFPHIFHREGVFSALHITKEEALGIYSGNTSLPGFFKRRWCVSFRCSGFRRGQ